MRAIVESRPNSFSFSIRFTLIATVVLAPMFCASMQGQDAARVAASVRPLITQTVDEAQLTTLKGNTHPLARAQFDLGTAPASLPMQRMLLVLKRSPEQETTLRRLIDDQQSKASPNYHKWLTPEQYGQQFGPTDNDLQTITAWLQSHGFEVGSTKGRTVLEFSGTAGQVQEAFHTTIHNYIVNGEQHWANANDPMIPSALTGAVGGVLTLHNFIKKPAIHFTGEAIPAKLAQGKSRPQVTFPAQGGQPAINALAPEDYKVIYNMNAPNLIAQSTIAVVGRSNLYDGWQDVSNFIGLFGGGNFLVILNGPDPGDLGGGEEAEATLDSSWSLGLAQNSTVDLVVSATTNATDGIDLSEAFIVENNLADIMTESFSACELYATDTELAFASTMAEQAAAQGITYIVSTGDNGTEGCDDPSVAPATGSTSVNYLASTAFNVAVGGTMFNENGDTSKYWASTAPLAETALSYIPEDVWNESSLTNGLWSSSGGASAGDIGGGFGGTTAGVPKPNWQYGVAGIPVDGVRDLPDVSLTAAGHDPYILCLDGSCEPNSQGEFSVYFVSGTSAAAPSFAAIMAYVDWQNVDAAGSSRVGAPNYVLYRLAAMQSSYPSQCNGSNSAPLNAACIFNDVTVGNNVVPGEVGTDYQAGAGYDLTTGLGSVNVGNLVSNWNSVSFSPTTTTFSITQTTNIPHGTPIGFSASVAPSSGSGIPTGDLSLEAFTGLLEQGASGLTLAGNYKLSQAAVTSSTAELPGGGPYWLTANYSGDTTYAPSQSDAVSITVTAEPSTTTVSVVTADQFGNSIPFTSGPFGSFVYLRADVVGQSAQGFATGTVTFSDTFGAVPGGSAFTLNGQGNTANPNGIFNFDTGTHTISASYGGDPSFNPSSSTQSQTFTITAGFYGTISAAQSTVVISAEGGTGTTSISVSNSTGFKGTISLACSGLPSEAACLFAPATIAANGTATTTSASITVTTAVATTSSQQRAYLPGHWLAGIGLLLGSTVLVGGKRQRVRGLFLSLTLLLLVVAPGCGGGSSGGASHLPPPNPGTPPGTSTILVTATSGSTVSTSAFTLVVQ